jgi:hypothetical protein
MKRPAKLFGITSISIECIGFALYVCLEGLASSGLIRFPFSPLNVQLARLSFVLLPIAVVTGLIGIFVDKKRTTAVVGVFSALPFFILMVMISGYW